MDKTHIGMRYLLFAMSSYCRVLMYTHVRFDSDIMSGEISPLPGVPFGLWVLL